MRLRRKRTEADSNPKLEGEKRRPLPMMRRYDPVIYLEPILFGPEAGVDVEVKERETVEEAQKVRRVLGTLNLLSGERKAYF